MKNIFKLLKIVAIINFIAGIFMIGFGLADDYHLALIVGGGCIGYCSVVFVMIYFKMISYKHTKENQDETTN